MCSNMKQQNEVENGLARPRERKNSDNHCRPRKPVLNTRSRIFSIEWQNHPICIFSGSQCKLTRFCWIRNFSSLPWAPPSSHAWSWAQTPTGCFIFLLSYCSQLHGLGKRKRPSWNEIVCVFFGGWSRDFLTSGNFPQFFCPMSVW